MATVTSNTPESTITTARTDAKPAAEGKNRSARREAWRRYFRAERRRFRESFTRERLISTLKTLGWVIPLTLLIWIYAEREQIATLEGVSIPIDVTTTDATRVVTLQVPHEGIVRADLRGPRSGIERLRRQIAPGRDGSALRLDIDPGLSTGRVHELRATALLNNHPDIWNLGISVRNVDPTNLQVYVDELDEREVPVRLPPEIENLAGPPTFTPPAATVTGPRQVLERASREGELYVIASLSNLSILNEPRQHELLSVRLTLPPQLRQDSAHISIQPQTVRAVLTVRARDVEFLIRSMPISPLPSPYDLLNNYRLELRDVSVTNVTVVGPPEQIELLRRPDYAPKPIAVLALRSDDANAVGQWQTRRVRIDELPPDVRVTEEPEVTFRLVNPGTADE